ncbi:MAG: preprotein translocase subunit SecG [Candidatus Marinimicrobia bacterium]|nr:preprotein translocase subunit SecG [Candidatus Neomarinimicrobiota bacterium]
MHILTSFLLVVVILLQSGKGGGLAGSMGGGVSTAMFGGQGADKLMIKMTSGLAGTFMILAILISLTGNPDKAQRESIVRQQAGQQLLAPVRPVTSIDLPELSDPAALPIPAADDKPVEDDVEEDNE